MENYLSKLFQISPEFKPKSYDFNYKPNYNGQQDGGGSYYNDEPQYSEFPFNVDVYGGADKHGKMLGGNVSGYIPTPKGSISGSIGGAYTNYGKPMKQLSGANIGYNTDKFSIGAEYFNAPVNRFLDEQDYNNPAFNSGVMNAPVEMPEQNNTPYLTAPSHNYLIRGRFNF